MLLVRSQDRGYFKVTILPNFRLRHSHSIGRTPFLGSVLWRVCAWRVGAGRVVGLRLYDAVAAFSMVQSRAPRAAHVIITAYVGTSTLPVWGPVGRRTDAIYG